jgi:Flp pilus assembly pilin Flp
MLRTLRRIHKDEQGLETLQVVMIVAIAALILGLLKLFWPQIKTWFTNLVNAIIQWQN